MNRYPESSIVQINVPFTDLNNAPVVPTEVRAVLFDGEEQVMEDFGAVTFNLVDGFATITILAQLNELTDLEPREARVLLVDLITASGTISKRSSYIIQAEQTLEIMANSFQTLETAEIAAIDMINLSGWHGAENESKTSALVDAYNKITQIPMTYYSVVAENGVPDERSDVGLTRDSWFSMTYNGFQALPARFRRALRRAQLLEANEIILGDNIQRKRTAGIVTETIGESSVTLRGNKMNFGLSDQAMSALTGFIRFDFRIVRA